MNERIRELIAQATSEEKDGFRYFDKEKFAELLIRECSQMVVYSHPEDLPFVGNKMLKHFGVE